MSLEEKIEAVDSGQVLYLEREVEKGGLIPETQLVQWFVVKTEDYYNSYNPKNGQMDSFDRDDLEDAIELYEYSEIKNRDEVPTGVEHFISSLVKGNETDGGDT